MHVSSSCGQELSKSQNDVRMIEGLEYIEQTMPSKLKGSARKESESDMSDSDTETIDQGRRNGDSNH